MTVQIFLWLILSQAYLTVYIKHEIGILAFFMSI